MFIEHLIILKRYCEEHRNLVQVFFLIINYFKLKKVFLFFCETCEQFLANCYVKGLCVCGSISNMMIVMVLCSN
ncbi:hypothetical protein A0H76_28 [Hepatospora eriocheir]|uniref:Uncharacterized protein n=1 Tax=Hepatospora eriocheir TaxID=1081669 RepID=A0A1X0QJA8_9MICR|nr:hypothetical protein A0H76_28 [Hepatospora eriocheir]